jgi:hypothetical protein
MINYEGGAIPEEYRTQYVVDRVNTTSTVWMGLTMGCAQCHDHKYDPLTQKEFYQFFAFFNNIPEQGLDGQKGNAVPFIKAPDEDQQARLAKVRSKLAETESRLKELEPQLAETQRGWEKAKLASLEEPPATGLIGHYELDHHLVDTSGRYHHGHLQGAVPTYKPGIVNTALELPGNAHVDLAGDYAFDSDQAFSYGAWIRPNDTSHQAVLSKMHDEADFRGFDLYYAGKVFVHLVHAWDKNAIRVNTKADVAPGQWHHVFATYDGSSKSSGVTLYVDGQPQKLEVTHDSLNGTLQTDKSLRIGSRNAGAPFKGLLDDVRIYERRLSANEVRQLAQDEPLRSMLATAPDQRQNEQRQDLRKRFLSEGAAPEYKAPHDRLAQLRTREQQILNESPTTMVMAEMDKPRETFMLARGSYDNPGEKVFATIPSALPPLAENEPANRLGLARWLVSSDHPLTARVTVNRYWQMYFGRGIVKTSEDFGSQGEWPTHPDLLDWLATEFIESGWDVKALQRLIVTSAAYRQSVRVTPALLESDPQNVLMARGPRLRLSAELIRDQALFVSGLINLEIGGPSVKPYQPPGLWREVAFGREFTAQSYEQDHGDKLYRRSMYTFWKRSCPPPSLSTFDAPDREVCTASRARTNTPLQALVLMNDPTYVESARHFARRILMESGQSMRERIGYAYEVALARAPSDVEIEILERVYRNQYERFSYDITAALELISVGDSDLPVEADMIELAAWTTLAGMILNLDEIVTRG